MATGLSVERAVERFFEHRRVRVSETSLRSYRDRLVVWMTWRERRGYSTQLADIPIEEFRAFLVYLTEEHTPYQDHPYRRSPAGKRMEPASIDGIYRALQIFWNFLADDDLLSDAQARFFQGRRLLRPVVPEEPRPVYGTRALDQLLEACAYARGPEEVARNRVMILMLYESGARINEVCSLHDANVDMDERTAIVYGKGRKYRYVFWTERTAAALDAYVAVRRGPQGGDLPLFRQCGNDPNAAQITADSFRSAVKRMADRAQLKLHANAPVHAFRHAFARRFLDSGGEGLHLQQFLGHASMRTTERYVRESPTKLRAIYRRIFGD
jgi:site-specific recombinase XerD